MIKPLWKGLKNTIQKNTKNTKEYKEYKEYKEFKKKMKKTINDIITKLQQN